MSTLLTLSVTVFVALLLTKYVMSRRHHRPYPPGPKPKLFIGNARDIPSKDRANVYIEWGKKYSSSIVHASAFGRHIVVVNKVEDAVELFEKRSTKYSDRSGPPFGKLMGMDHHIVTLRYGERWRYCRRICNQNFRKEAVKSYHGIMLQKVHAMLDGLLRSPEKFERHNKMLSISIPMKTMYGYDVESFDDPCVTAAEKRATLAIQLFASGASFVNIFPILAYIPAWFPGASSQKIMAEVKRLTEEVMRLPMDWAKMRMSDGTAIPSLVTNFLEKKNTVGASEQEESAIEDIAFTVYGAASDTTVSAIGSFFYYMAVNAGVQERAQREIDRVVGRNRLPDFSDRPAMPYIEAIYREVLRCRPPLHLGVAHCLMEDDQYKEHYIPKGAMVMGNIWAMTHDESVYPEPFTFKPERFFDENGALNNDDKILAYGFGRRVCAGEHVASATVWLTFASILATFNIGKARDEAGKEIEISDEYEDLVFINRKKKFECSISPRSREHQQLIEEANMSNK